MKKLISIGVALALLAIAMVPGAVAAQCDYEGVEPDTYAKIPFAILESGFVLFETLWPDLDAALGMDMLWLGDVFGELGSWVGGPLAWTVDMLGWGISLGAGILDSLGPTLGLPDYVGEVLNDIACGLFTPFTCVVPGAPPFDPCA